MNVIDFKGKVLWELQKTVVVPANGNEKVYTSALGELIKESDLDHALFICSLTQMDEYLSKNKLYFKPPKDLDLPVVNVDLKIKETSEGYQIKLFSDALAKNVYLISDKLDGFFSDNYFDLLPGQEVTIKFNTSDRMHKKENLFKVRTIKDTYE